MSLWVALEPLSTVVEAGDNAEVMLRIRNTGDIVEEYHVDVVGDPALWCTIEPSAVRLYPGTTTSVRLTFSPPRTSDSAAGPHPYGVRVMPVESPDAVMVPEGNLTVAPFIDVRAELMPPAVRGWRRAKPQLVVDNYGNAVATAAVSASGSGSRIDFDIRTPSIQVPPGRAHFSVLRLRPDRVLWMGQKASHPYTATLQPSGSDLVSASGNYIQSALLPRWLAAVFAVLLALAAVFAGIWFTASPSVASEATAQAAPTTAATLVAATTAAPSASPSATTASPAAPTSAAGGGSASASSSTVTLPAPVSWWKLGDRSSSSVYDTMGANPAAISNLGWCGAPGACALFNGSSSIAQTDGAVLNTGSSASFTVTASVWLYKTSSTIEQTMVSQDSTANDSGFYLQFTGFGTATGSDRWAFARVGTDTADPTAYRAYSTIAVQAQVWTNLTGVYDATDNQLRLYVNGQLQGTATDPTPYEATGPLVMGRGQFDGKAEDWYGGAMDNVEVFNQALTDKQVKLLPGK